jgi:hypothetical protein
MRSVRVIAAISILLSCGCAHWPHLAMPSWKGEGFQESDQKFSKLGSRLRPKSDLTAVGVSSKAREIEENLGAQ